MLKKTAIMSFKAFSGVREQFLILPISTCWNDIFYFFLLPFEKDVEECFERNLTDAIRVPTTYQ